MDAHRHLRPHVVDAPALVWLLRAFCFLVPGIGVFSPNAMVPLLVAVAVFVAGLDWYATRRVPRPDRAFAWAFAALLVWSAVASIWNFDPWRSIELSFRLAALLFAGLLLIEVARGSAPATREAAMRALLWGVGLAGLLMLSEWATDLFLLRLARGVPSGEVLPPEELNRQSVNMVLSLWPMLVYLGRERRFALAAVLFAPAALAVCLLASLAAIVALGLGVLFFLLALWRPQAGRRAVFAMVAVAVAGSAPIAWAMHTYEVQRIEGIDGSSAEHRIEIWRYAVGLIERRPLFGWGFDASRHLDQHDETRFTGPDRVKMSLHPHNGPIQVWLELGVPGVLAALAVSLLAVRRANRYGGVALAGAHGFVASALLVACISFGIWQNQWLAAILSVTVLLVLAARERAPPAGSAPGSR